MTHDEILTTVETIGCKKVTITGGEPLMQKGDFIELTRRLWHGGYVVSVETNGSYSLEGYGVLSWVVDYKLPSSGMEDKMNPKAFESLGANDFIKFVILDLGDYLLAVIKAKEFSETNRAKILFSPCLPMCIPKDLIERMRNDRLFDYQVNLQLHKLVDIGEAK
jgi:7-carboxy-7-deazaguanine synthase